MENQDNICTPNNQVAQVNKPKQMLRKEDKVIIPEVVIYRTCNMQNSKERKNTMSLKIRAGFDSQWHLCKT